MFLVFVCPIFLIDRCVEGAFKLQDLDCPSPGTPYLVHVAADEVHSSCDSSPCRVSQPGLSTQVLARPCVVVPFFIHFYFVSETVSRCSQAGFSLWQSCLSLLNA